MRSIAHVHPNAPEAPALDELLEDCDECAGEGDIPTADGGYGVCPVCHGHGLVEPAVEAGAGLTSTPPEGGYGCGGVA